MVDRADVMIAGSGRAIAVRDADGVLRVSGSRSGSYTIEQFFDKESIDPLKGDALRIGVACDSLGCLIGGAEGIRVAHVRDPVAFAEDCRRADIVVTPLTAPIDCAAPLVIDAKRLAGFGSHAVRVKSGSDGPRFSVTAERSSAPRPWQAGGGTEAE
jgi:competence protein ComEC